jgi:uncharacterized protein with NRDE domain
MCIVLITTAHPDYAAIIIDNRDEFITRPTSRPHWWSSHHQDILSSRDLQRAEQGTWLGITKAGNFAVLTNFRETDANDKEHPVQGQRSRGGMVTAWLTAQKDESTIDFVHRLLSGEGVKGVGGFSLVCGKLRKHKTGDGQELEPLAIVSNRCGVSDDVPWIAEKRSEVYGLSNTSYADPIAWPKVESGKRLLSQAVEEVVEAGLDEEELVSRLFRILDTNTLPAQNGSDFDDYLMQLKHSIFIPNIGGAEVFPVVPKAAEVIASAAGAGDLSPSGLATSTGHVESLQDAERPEPEPKDCMSGVYGTQRQTIILVDWEGNVSFRERSLWDEDGRAVPRGKGDVKFEFQIEGWHGEEAPNGSYMESHI